MKKKKGYVYSIVAFIDILGFKQIIQSTNNDTKLEALVKCLEDARIVGDINVSAPRGLEGYQGKMFSDSFTMSIPIGRGNLYIFLMQIYHFQGVLANSGIFLRGAITIGNHFEDNDLVFGPALVNAVELERTVAIWPRIVVHPEVIKLANNPALWTLPEQPEKDIIADRLERDADGITYVNYLDCFAADADEDEEMFLKNHRIHIIENAKANESQLRVLAKYYWLANYHNAVVTKRNYPELCINMSRKFPTL